MVGAGLELPRIDSGIFKKSVVPKDETEHEGRLPRMVDVARNLEIVGNAAFVDERIVIEGVRSIRCGLIKNLLR